MKSAAFKGLAILILITGFARADVVKLASLGEKESVEVNQIQEGTIPLLTQFTFSAGKVTVAQGGKKIGDLPLTASELTRIDRYLDLIRNGRRGSGNGSLHFTIKFIRDGKERRNMGEKFSIREIGDSKMSVLSLDELKERASK